MVEVCVTWLENQVDVTNEALVKEAVNNIVAELNGQLNILVASSSIPWTQGAMIDGDISHCHKVMSTDLDPARQLPDPCEAEQTQRCGERRGGLKTRRQHHAGAALDACAEQDGCARGRVA